MIMQENCTPNLIRPNSKHQTDNIHKSKKRQANLGLDNTDDSVPVWEAVEVKKSLARLGEISQEKKKVLQ